MSVFAIGDPQGCFECFDQLRAMIARSGGDSTPEWWFCGDLVNRGPQSLAMLRWVYEHRAQAVTVLGNHDLHLLSILAGVRGPGRSDTLDDIIRAPDCALLTDWLRRQPLAHFAHEHLLVHAGVLPQWTVAQTLDYAAEVQEVLSGANWREFLAGMYGNAPSTWSNTLRGIDRLRSIVNVLTRLRFCRADGEMEFATKEGAHAAPAGFQAWFDIPGRASADTTIVFGHWSTLGLLQRESLLGIDTGCVWGGSLTAVRLEDRELFQVACPRAVTPGLG